MGDIANALLLSYQGAGIINNGTSAYTVITEAKSKSKSNSDNIANNIIKFNRTNSNHEFIQNATSNSILSIAEPLYIDELTNGDDNMDDNKILEMYISKVDADQSELKQDMRESEKRLENHIITSEQRMDEKLGRIESLIQSQDQKFDKMNDNMIVLSKEVSNKLDDNRKFMWGIVISIFLGIVAMIVTMIVSLNVA